LPPVCNDGWDNDHRLLLGGPDMPEDTSPFAGEATETIAPSCTYHIWIAGDYNRARFGCNNYCSSRGACFALTRVDYIFSGGEEAGVRVTIINYPRFPKSPDELKNTAIEMAYYLMAYLNQTSCSVEGPEESVFISRKKGSEPMALEDKS